MSLTMLPCEVLASFYHLLSLGNIASSQICRDAGGEKAFDHAVLGVHQDRWRQMDLPESSEPTWPVFKHFGSQVWTLRSVCVPCLWSGWVSTVISLASWYSGWAHQVLNIWTSSLLVESLSPPTTLNLCHLKTDQAEENYYVECLTLCYCCYTLWID